MGSFCFGKVAFAFSFMCATQILELVVPNKYGKNKYYFQWFFPIFSNIYIKTYTISIMPGQYILFKFFRWTLRDIVIKMSTTLMVVNSVKSCPIALE